MYHVGDDRQLDLLDELELEKDEDAPMSMATNIEVSAYVFGGNLILTF